MNSSFQLLKGETDGEKINLPRLNANHFFKGKSASSHSEEKKTRKGLTHVGEQPILLTWSVSKWCNTASFVVNTYKL